MIISLDSECTGLDLAHGAAPFLVTTCNGDGVIKWWEWDVDPLTRAPSIPDGDVEEIVELIDAADVIYMQNAKYDVRAMANIGVAIPWPKVRDTMAMGHLLGSNLGHKLEDMCADYLLADIRPLELRVKEVVRACRDIVKRSYPTWKIAREGVDGMPSVKESSNRDEDKPWKNDLWLPRALAKVSKVNPFRLQDNSSPNQNWLEACAAYANGDSEHTLYLGLEMERLIRERGLWAIYEHRLHLPRLACEMELYGTTVVGEWTEATIQDYEQYVAEANDALREIAAGYGHDLRLAEGAALNDNMREFFYGAVVGECPRCGAVRHFKHWSGESTFNAVCAKCAKGTKRRAPVRQSLAIKRRDNLALQPIVSAKSGNATLDKEAMRDYLTTLDGPALEFVRLLADKRKRDTDLTYMLAYKRFWLPVPGHPGFYRIHPSLNPFATDHLRWSSNSPNLQNVGGQEDKCVECDGDGCDLCSGTGKSRISVRNCFGPLPDREWWRMDYKSIENRIPAYESGEPKMIEVFEHPDDEPYWGSLYNLTASVFYPDRYWPLAKRSGAFKREEPRLYKQAKFFNLAKQYGCGRRKGDALSKVRNSFDLVNSEFPRLAALQARYLADAERCGYVETLPDRAVDPTRGYPILASRTDDNRVLSTTPFNYHVSGTACWCKNTALVRCSAQCVAWRADGFDANIVLEVHDEINFDFPRGATMEENLPRAMVLRGLMEQSGDDLIPRVPTPVSVSYHTQSWAQGVEV